eukprot:2293364-Prymnesium_polylepis.1
MLCAASRGGNALRAHGRGLWSPPCAHVRCAMCWAALTRALHAGAPYLPGPKGCGPYGAKHSWASLPTP